MARFPKGYVKHTSSCPGCLAWGDFRGRLCHTCYMFGRGHDAAECVGCRRVQPLKWDYCRLCWCQARLGAKTANDHPSDGMDVWERLAAVRHHQLFFVQMHYRRRPTPPARPKGGRRGAPRKPSPAPAWRPDPGWQQQPLFEQIPRDFGRLDPADADLASPGWPGRSTLPTGSPRPAAGDATSASPSTGAWPSSSPATSKAT